MGQVPSFPSSLASVLTYSVLRMVHPAVVVLLPVSIDGVEVSVRLRERAAVVQGVEFVLAVEDASALAGEGGDVEPAESPRQARRSLLVKRAGPPVPSHPLSAEESPRRSGCRRAKLNSNLGKIIFK